MTHPHTPGPWWLDDDGFVASGNGETYVTVADPHCSSQDIDEREANACLIAKAPDLKAALAWALDRIEDDLDPDHQAALAAARALVED